MAKLAFPAMSVVAGARKMPMTRNAHMKIAPVITPRTMFPRDQATAQMEKNGRVARSVNGSIRFIPTSERSMASTRTTGTSSSAVALFDDLRRH
jgi:hypothetical protein